MDVTLSREKVLSEIRRTAESNGGKPLGVDRFVRETGINRGIFFGGLWARYGDAVREAGLEPNQKNAAIDRDLLLTKYVELARRLGRLPVSTELRLEARNDSQFPAHSVWANRFGGKRELVRHLREDSRERPDHKDILEMCEAYESQPVKSADFNTDDSPSGLKAGWVYLMQHSGRREYKIGKTNDVGRRQRELQTGSPDRLVVIHWIRTDDIDGIEAYWHNRFENRSSGEWFQLTNADMTAFKRRKLM